METIRVVILLLLASFLVFTTASPAPDSPKDEVKTNFVSSDETPAGPAPDSPKDEAKTNSLDQSVSSDQTSADTAPDSPKDEAKTNSSDQSGTISSAAPAPINPTTSTPVTTVKAADEIINSSNNDTLAATLPTAQDSATTANKSEPSATIPPTPKPATTLPVLNPRAPTHGNNTIDSESENITTPVSPKDESLPKADNSSQTSDGKQSESGPSNNATAPPEKAPGMPATDKTDKATQSPQGKDAGPQSGNPKDKETPKSDRRLLWILLPVLGVAVAALVFIFKFKCMKVHDHTETIDNGTENASFQSRPESTKDGVMLLGVKSSGGEENAAAR